jgi:diaminobutyrate-2-oxoglutarate transaminase
LSGAGGLSGTNSVDAALELTRKVAGRTNVVSSTIALHGLPLGSLSVTGNQHHRKTAKITLSGATVIPYDGYFGFDHIGYLDRLIGDPGRGVDDPAAAIAETVPGEGGLNTADRSVLEPMLGVAT